MNYSKKGIRKKQQQLNSKSTKFGKMVLLTFLKAFLICCLGIAIIGGCMGIGMFKGILASAPDISTLNVTPTGYATIVYDADGKQITKLVSTNSNRSYVGKESIPQYLADAFVAIEDERFYTHNGIDIKGIARAAVTGVQNKFHFSQGASTITQQLLKNNVFDDWVTETNIVNKFKRKFQEQYLALELEKRMSKEDILELYMNSINLGQNTLGVQAASMRYFNKPVSELNLSECAVIAAITQNPTKLNPISHPENNLERRNKVLNNMLEQGYITQSEYETAMADDVYSRIKIVNESIEKDSVNSYFVDALIDQVIEDLIAAGYNETQAYNLVYSGGLQIYSTQDPAIQAICDEVYQDEENYPSNVKWYLHYELTVLTSGDEYVNHSTEMLKNYFLQSNAKYDLLYTSQDDAYADIEEYKSVVMSRGDEVYAETISLTPQPQVSITVEDQHTGYVVAMVGGRGTKSASRTLNRATNATRQPGSTFKIVSTYAPALDSAGLTLASVEYDGPYNYADGTPVNNWYTGYKNINCSVRYGIEQSLNIVTVKFLTRITPQLGFDYLTNFGFTTLVERKEVTNSAGETEIYSDIQQSLALGGITDGVTNMELNAAYATIANGGTYIKPALYSRILDHDGNVLLDRTEPETRRVIKETTAFLLTDAMVDVVTKGTGGSVNFDPQMAIAGKTGTTTSYRDVWFSGYTPYYTATTWTGYDNNAILEKGNGERNLSKTLWRAVMSRIHEELPKKSFTRPNGIVTASVCSQSGKLPIAGLCDAHQSVVTEYFAEGTVPTEYCDVHYQGNVCLVTGLPACDTCPYKAPGILTLPLNDDGTSAASVCPHTPDYYINNPGAMITDSQTLQQIQQQNAAQQPQAPPPDPTPPAPETPAETPPADPGTQ